MTRLYCILATWALASGTLVAQQITKSTAGTFALTNATIETVTQGTVSGTLLIRDGKIAGIGDVAIPDDAQSVDCQGLTAYPGMIDGGTTLGTSEIGAVSLTRDFNELGDIRPQMEALTAVNPNSVLIPVTRVNGVTTVLTQPTGGRFPGTAALINLHGYTPKQMYAGFRGVVLNYPSSTPNRRQTAEEAKKEAEKALKALNKFWDQLKVYHRIDSAATAAEKDPPDYNPAFRALLPTYRGEAPLLIGVNAYKDIRAAIKWVEKKKIRAIFTGVAEGWRVAEELAKAKIPVITGPVLATPSRASDRYDKAYANAGIMHHAGVQVALRTNETENVRNLPYHAGFAATYGLGKVQALRAVTIVPAQIFGVDDQLGSLEVGKVANLFVTDGDPFETSTTVQHLFIEGYKVPLESRHTYLYDEFLDRKPGLKE